MEEYMEGFFSAAPSWADVNGGSRAPWDFNNSSNNSVSGAPNSVDNGAAIIPGGSIQTSMIPNDGTQMEQLHDNTSNSRGEEPTDVQYPFEPSMGSLRHHHHNNMDSQDGVVRRITESISDSSQVGAAQLNRSASMLAAISSAAASRGIPGFANSSSLVSAGNEGTVPSLGHTASVAPMWRQLYMAGIVPPLPLGQPKVESLSPSEGTLNDSLLSGKRCRDEDEDRSGHHESMFGSFGAAPMCQSMLAARNDTSQSMHQQLQGVSGAPYGNHPNLVQQLQSPPTIGPAGGSVRPRIRARRGQATDPHSIAERLRRERIAERMRNLQDLVPSANKTDKALMLDEIIEYVKFLQLQVKVLSMSRLGATVPGIGSEGYNNVAMGASNGGASGSSQDSMSATEKHVARLMEEDMGTAMQYLQGKGLCLMPSSVANAIPNTNPNPRMASSQGLINSTDCFRMDLSPPPPAPSSIAAASGNATTSPILPPVHVSNEGLGHGLLSNGAWNSKDTAPTGLDQLNRAANISTPSATSGCKNSEDSVRHG